MTYGPGKHGEITRALLAAFPSFEDVEVMCKTARRQTLYFHLNSCKTYGQLEQEGLTPLALPTSAAELMNSHAHPVFMATNMLMFAFVLQLPVFCKVNSFAESPSKIANRLVEAASNLVTNNDKLYGTMELLQCMLYESQFHKSIGNLRRAWLAGRRALLVGQMMGIHRPGARPAKTIDPNYKIDQHVVWFRIVHADRSLCLLLGFPQGTLDTSMASETALASDAPLGRLERHLTVIASRILERNELGLSDHHFTTTQDIDTELLRVGKTIPTKFWLRSGLSGIENGSEEDFWETERFTSQVFYYNLLNQLHLPYLLRFDDKGQHEYSKVSCVHASREILGLFVTYRTFNKTPVCHRVLDFLALMAATTLLLAHFDSQLHRKANSFLAHQRLSDRAMIEQVLETMDAFCMLNEDVLTGKSTEVLRCLLHVEDDAAGGRSYSARSVHQSGTMPEEEAGDKQEGGYGKSLVLRICIPYFGYIKITGDGAMHQEPDPERLHPAASTADTLHNLIVEHATPQVPGFVEDFTLEQYDVPEMTAGLDDWAFQGVDTALFDSLMSGASTANINGSNAGWNSYV